MGVMDSSPVQLEDGSIEMVSKFTYLGSSVASDGDLSREVLLYCEGGQGIWVSEGAHIPEQTFVSRNQRGLSIEV